MDSRVMIRRLCINGVPRLLFGDCCSEIVVRRLLFGDCCSEIVVRRLLFGDCCSEIVVRRLLFRDQFQVSNSPKGLCPIAEGWPRMRPTLGAQRASQRTPKGFRRCGRHRSNFQDSFVFITLAQGWTLRVQPWAM